MRLALSDFTRGLWLVGGKETTIKGFLRRARGVHELRTPSLRSRAGSTEIYTTNDVNSIIKFNGDHYYVSEAGVLYKNGVSVYTGIASGPTKFLKAPPQPGIDDWLFWLDGAAPKKISTADVVRNWGIAQPGSGVTLADAGVGAMAAGIYQYHVVFRNLTTGSRSNPNVAPTSINQAAGRRITVSNIPTSADPQVNARELYRTTANGARFFKLTEIGDNVTTTFADNTTDASLQSLELQFDNAPPSSFFFSDVWQTLDQRVWWLNSQTGTGGNAYYSPPGRPESVRGFISVCGTDEFLTKGFTWNGANWVFSISKLYRIVGDDEPFVAIPIDGVPGTSFDWTVTITPYGVAYLSYDGVYLFDGTRAELIGFDELALIFRGENVENIDLVVGVSGPPTRMLYARDQLYLCSPLNGTNNLGQTLVFNFRTKTWRDLGLKLDAIYKEPDTQNILASFADNVYILEDPGTVQDGTTDIPLEWEFGAALSDIAHFGTIQRVYLDINTSSAPLTVTLIVDNSTVALGTVSTASRQLVEFPVPSGWKARVFAVRLSGTINAKVELFHVALDIKLEGANEEVGIG